MHHAFAAVRPLCGRADLHRVGGGEQQTRAGRIQHAGADKTGVHRLVAGPAAGDDGYSLLAFGGVVKQKPHEALVVPLRARVRGDKAAEGLPHEVVAGVTK